MQLNSNRQQRKKTLQKKQNQKPPKTKFIPTVAAMNNEQRTLYRQTEFRVCDSFSQNMRVKN